MLKRVMLAFALTALPLAAQAEDAPIFAEYWADSGSLPPEFAWETNVTIYENGRLQLKHCRGYETEGPACKRRTAKVAPEALAAIRAAATESGLAEKPATEPEDVPVGGGMTGGRVMLDGKEIKLPSYTTESDRPRVSAVIVAIEAAIPSRFDRLREN